MTARTKRRKWPWLLLLLVIAGGAAFFVLNGSSAPPPLDPALIITAKRGTLAVEILDTGKVTPREKVELKSKVAGQATQVLVQEGERVKKGQLLVVLDPIDFQREVAKAEADVALAKSGLAYAKIALDRRKVAVDASVGTQSDLDAASADAASKAVSVMAAQVGLATAQDHVRYTRIFSPMDGTVIQRGIQPGETVVPGVQSTFDGKSLLTIADLSVLVVKIELNQIDVTKVRLGQHAELTLDALPGRSYPAVITRIAPASVRPPNKDVDVFPIEATLAEPDGRILPGMTADVRIRLDEKLGVVTLPIEAIVKDAGKTFVKRVVEDPVAPSRTEKIEVVLGVRSDRSVEIVSGLDENARVLLDPPSAAANETRM
jgi:membrane fusion protein, macrolide-specific efflux system